MIQKDFFNWIHLKSKRLTEEILMDINELILKSDDDDDQPTSSGGADEGSNTQEDNKCTLILEATCAPQNIEFSQDINLLNETREKLEGIIDALCPVRISTNREFFAKRLDAII